MSTSKRSFLALTLALILSILAGCGPSNHSQTSTFPSGSLTDSSQDENSSGGISSSSEKDTSGWLSPAAYEESLSFAPWTKANHLYIHYYRENEASLDNWAL